MGWYETEVEVIGRSSDALLILDGDLEVWVPHEKIGPDSEITEESCEGESGLIQIPDWLAIDEGLVEE